MAYSDKYPTCYDLRPIRPEELTQPLSITDVEEDARQPLSITEVEQRALQAVDLGEKISQGVNKFDLARAGIRLSARTARKFRK